MHDYFKHPLPNVRTAPYIKPKRLYHNFGHPCVCLSHTEQEQTRLRKWPDRALPLPLLLQAAHTPQPLHEMDNIYDTLFTKIKTEDVPAHCNFCDFYKCGLPCPLNNVLANGKPVCLTHKYIIIKNLKWNRNI